jgi:glutamate racemase
MKGRKLQKPRDQALGVFDSGIGGLTVVKALRRALPHEHIIYLGDTARVPYGSKSAATVIRYAQQTAAFLLGKGVKYLVVACNTASAHAIEVLREEAPVPVMGVIAPGAQVAVQRTTEGRVGVIGTLGTVESGAYHQAIHALDPALSVFGQACPLFVPLVEEGWLSEEVTAMVARRYMTELRVSAGDLDTIVLGCTHYPLLKDLLASVTEKIFAHPVELVDSAEAVSLAVADDLRRRDLHRPPGAIGHDHFYLTDISRFSEVGRFFLGDHLAAPQLADI